jgi:hypothetical protein
MHRVTGPAWLIIIGQNVGRPEMREATKEAGDGNYTIALALNSAG